MDENHWGDTIPRAELTTGQGRADAVTAKATPTAEPELL